MIRSLAPATMEVGCALWTDLGDPRSADELKGSAARWPGETSARMLSVHPGRRHMAASLRAFIDLAHEIVVRSRAKTS
jgi:hypothetical protein